MSLKMIELKVNCVTSVSKKEWGEGVGRLSGQFFYVFSTIPISHIHWEFPYHALYKSCMYTYFYRSFFFFIIILVCMSVSTSAFFLPSSVMHGLNGWNAFILLREAVLWFFSLYITETLNNPQFLFISILWKREYILFYSSKQSLMKIAKLFIKIFS